MEVALAPCAECGLKMSMKVASYDKGARLRENDQTHRPSSNSTFFLPCALIFTFNFNFKF